MLMCELRFSYVKSITICLFDEGSFVIPCVGNLTEEKSCMCNEISCVVFPVTSVSMFNN
jgi:hypothetical protein